MHGWTCSWLNLSRKSMMRLHQPSAKPVLTPEAQKGLPIIFSLEWSTSVCGALSLTQNYVWDFWMYPGWSWYIQSYVIICHESSGDTLTTETEDVTVANSNASMQLEVFGHGYHSEESWFLNSVDIFDQPPFEVAAYFNSKIDINLNVGSISFLGKLCLLRTTWQEALDGTPWGAQPWTWEETMEEPAWKEMTRTGENSWR